jgi:acyl-CoA synthetase (AMP-forming)/AMP-acid ligase II/thioesterase domain-containing protein
VDSPAAIAIEGLGREGLTYERLSALIGETRSALRRAGIARNGRVAVVLPNGPEMATVFIAVASAATCAPLNPAYREAEFDFYLSDLAAKALIVEAGASSPAREVAARRGIPIIELRAGYGGPAGTFSLDAGSSAGSHGGFAEADDVALVLHTSGTTSRPKMVPLSHANVTISAESVARALRLSASDRCLNIMPLFHIHGIVGALLSSIAAGAGVVCAPGFLAPEFMDWVNESRPTWYTAVPTMHRAILSRAQARPDVVGRRRFRFIRSCSAALPPKLMEEMERTFGAPVIESYGMTEAAHQMASNPLPPGVRKPGSVGVAAGPEVAIMDAEGRMLPAGAKGEIVIRGANVTTGYENNPEANRSAFTNGWFRTGDEGYLDADNYLFLTGRIKEMINRGGEKISPREVDEVLLDHPAVAQAVAFAMPDLQLGEEIAAAIVLRQGASATEREIQEFAAARLADFKVPRRVVFLADIPKGPTGKLQRIGLAEKLGLTGAAESEAGPAARAEFLAPRTPVEEALVRIWSAELKVAKVGVRDNFFDLGGDSVLASRVFAVIAKTFGKRLPLTVLFEAPTVEKIAAILGGAGPQALSPIVAIKKSGARPPFFCMANWDAFVLAPLAALMDPGQPFYGIHPQGLVDPDRPEVEINGLASAYLDFIRAVQPRGPYRLGGKCSSGFVAYEVAQRLRAAGEEVALLVLIDTPGPRRMIDALLPVRRGAVRLARHVRDHLAAIWRLALSEKRAYVANMFRRYKGRLAPEALAAARAPVEPDERAMWAALKRARMNYYPKPYDSRIVMIVTPEYRRPLLSGAALRWRKLALSGVEVHEMNCGHHSLLREPYVRTLAALLKRYLPPAP